MDPQLPPQRSKRPISPSPAQRPAKLPRPFPQALLGKHQDRSAIDPAAASPPVAGLPSSVSKLNRLIESTLSHPSNPITHSDSFRRAHHVAASSTGHQQSSARSASSHPTWRATRLAKLRAQAKAPESDVLSRVVVYINGYTGTQVTNQELIQMVQKAGGQVRPILNATCTHVVTALPVCAKKIEGQLKRKKLSSGFKYVKPEWVLDSVRIGRRQPESKYPVLVSETQPQISSVFPQASSSKP